MEMITQFIDIFMHLDRHLGLIIRDYGVWTHAILFILIFCETGLVITPLLPGDSLLFAVGTFAALGSLDMTVLIISLSVAAIAGDTVNYWIGHFVGHKVFSKERSRFFKRDYLDRTHRFYERYGGKTIIIARFIPIIRTFAPFVAGIGRMTYLRFSIYNVAGGVAWIAAFLFGGYFFGALPLVRQNFSLVVLAIIAISLLPGFVEFLRHKFS